MSHVIAVCQPCVPVLAALAVMAQGGNVPPARSATLMAGPIDTRVNPTSVNDLACSKPLSWFERNVISTVPWPHPGAGRRVYPGFLQVTAFVNMNLERHVRSHYELFFDLVNGDVAGAEAKKTFYDEYFTVLDMAAEFYLETVHTRVPGASARPRRARIPRRSGSSRPRSAGCRCSRWKASATTSARSDRPSRHTTSAPASAPLRKRHHLQPGVGHYGVFSGRRWDTQIYPIVRNVIESSD